MLLRDQKPQPLDAGRRCQKSRKYSGADGGKEEAQGHLHLNRCQTSVKERKSCGRTSESKLRSPQVTAGRQSCYKHHESLV